MQTEMLDTIQAAEYLGLGRHTLEIWRCTGRYNLPYFKVGRIVRYKKSDLDEWVEKRRRGEAAEVQHV